jgi:hypothetical protein
MRPVGGRRDHGAMERAEERERRRRVDAVTWAAVVAWVGVVAVVPAALALDAALAVLQAVVSVFVPEAAGADLTGWVLAVAVAAAGTGLVAALGSAWVLATTPGSSAPPWLVGSASGVLGWAVGAGVGWVALTH